jgi:2-methylisocitrate lyase-like PEP mutase family enzyme
MTTTESAGTRLRRLIETEAPIVVPGCADALSARLIEEAGFPAAYLSGGWTACAHGYLDLGLLTLDEMLGNARRIAKAIDIPLIADVDTGFGSAINVRRCIEDFEAAGVAGIHIEDQKLPKKCGLVKGKECVPVREMCSKLRAAVDVRRDPGFYIICRTDALASEGLERTIERGHQYFEAGADMLWVEGLRDEDDAAGVAEAFRGRHLLFNRTPRGYGPLSSLEQVREWGYAIVFLCMHLELAALTVQKEFLDEFRATGACDSFEDRMYDLHATFELLGESRMAEIEARYHDAPVSTGA